MPRIVGLVLVTISAAFFYGLTIPGLFGSNYEVAVACFAGVGGTFFGMPLLVTGRVRQSRRQRKAE